MLGMITPDCVTIYKTILGMITPDRVSILHGCSPDLHPDEQRDVGL